MAAVNFVKFSPLLGGERAQDGMPKHGGLRAESLFSIRERGIHGDKGIIELTQRFVS